MLRQSGNIGGARRGGFTIIELLVVVTIIAILMTLVLQVVGAFINQARDSATKSTLEKNQGLINTRAQGFNRLIMRKGFLSGTPEMVFVQKNYTTLTPATQTTIATKFLEMRYFPQQVQELENLIIGQNGMRYYHQNLVDTYQRIFSQSVPPGQNISSLSQYQPGLDANHMLRSSEILYDVLTQSNVLGGATVGADAFTGAEVKDTDGNGLPEFIDGWGNPLRFYRWPTRLFRSGGATTSAPFLASITAGDVANAKLLFASLPVFSGNLINDLNRDPDDPLRNCVGIPNFEQSFHTPATYHVLLIVSPGPDGKLGLCEPDSIDPFTNKVVPFGNLALPSSDPNYQDALTDNIVYLNVRAGGK